MNRKKDPDKYNSFIEEFGQFLKEGVITDSLNKNDIAKLLRYETSKTNPGKLISFDDYIERLATNQTNIYYLQIPNRNFAEVSPYYESFKQKGIEVFFLYNQLDDFIMNTINEYKGKKLISIESSDVDKDSNATESKEGLTDREVTELSKWLKDTLSDKISNVKASYRLVSSPAIVVDHESANMRRMMKFVDQNRTAELPKQTLEFNPKHVLIRKLNVVRNENISLAKHIAEQLFDNALIAAGLLDDPRTMLNRLNSLMEASLQNVKLNETESTKP